MDTSAHPEPETLVIGPGDQSFIQPLDDTYMPKSVLRYWRCYITFKTSVFLYWQIPTWVSRLNLQKVASQGERGSQLFLKVGVAFPNCVGFTNPKSKGVWILASLSKNSSKERPEWDELIDPIPSLQMLTGQCHRRGHSCVSILVVGCLGRWWADMEVSA